jgi:DTW domain-containing protein YfiP
MSGTTKRLGEEKRDPDSTGTGATGRSAEAAVEVCAICGKSPAICVCDKSSAHPTRLKVLILQHPQEQDVDLGTARLLTTNLEQARIAVGLSWRSFAHVIESAFGVDEAPARKPSRPVPPHVKKRVDREIDPARWAVIFPRKEPAEGTGTRAVDKNGKPLAGKRLDGIVVLDGTWSQAKTLWWRNAWLLKLNRIILEPKEPSIYGAMRKEPRREYVSTLEAVAETLEALGEPASVKADLRRVFRTMVQRARDARKG